MHFKKERCKRIKIRLAFSAINVCCQNAFKDAKEAAQQKRHCFFFQVYSLKQTSCYDVIVHLRYDVDGLELTDWTATLS